MSFSPCLKEYRRTRKDNEGYTTLTPQIKGKGQCIKLLSYRTHRCADTWLVHCYNALMQLPLFYIGAQMRYRLWVLVF